MPVQTQIVKGKPKPVPPPDPPPATPKIIKRWWPEQEGT